MLLATTIFGIYFTDFGSPWLFIAAIIIGCLLIITAIFLIIFFTIKKKRKKARLKQDFSEEKTDMQNNTKEKN